MTQNYQALRQRAFLALFQGVKPEELTQQDYLFDDLVRHHLKLPKRPDKALPYLGWLVSQESTKTSDRFISGNGIRLIKQQEGCMLVAYQCSANVWTIGYGHTKTAWKGKTINLEQANELLQEDLQTFANAVNQLVKVDLTQNQFDALVSFVFNIGIDAFKYSTMLRMLNKGEYGEAAKQFDKWNKVGIKRIEGLVRRREAEKALFLQNNE
jgi:lysozyme